MSTVQKFETKMMCRSFEIKMDQQVMLICFCGIENCVDDTYSALQEEKENTIRQQIDDHQETLDAMLGRSESFERVRAVQLSLEKFAVTRQRRKPYVASDPEPDPFSQGCHNERARGGRIAGAATESTASTNHEFLSGARQHSR